MTVKKTTSLPLKAKKEVENELFPLEGAFLTLKKPEDVSCFLLDLCTPAEIADFRERWHIAQLVDRGMPYREIAEKANSSTATVTRVARFLQHERHRGYQRALKRLQS